MWLSGRLDKMIKLKKRHGQPCRFDIYEEDSSCESYYNG